MTTADGEQKARHNLENARRRLERNAQDKPSTASQGPQYLYQVHFRFRHHGGELVPDHREVIAGSLREVMRSLPPTASHLKARRGRRVA